jgi:hypothetical protein
MVGIALVLAAGTARAAAGDLDDAKAPSLEGQVPAEAPPAAAPPAAPATAAWRRALVGSAGLGFYERLHLGLAYEPGPASTVGVFAGSNLGVGDAATWDVGLAWGLRLWQVSPRLEAGLDAKALYWEQSNPDYDWKIMTLGFGAYLGWRISPVLSVVLDGGVAFNVDLASVRKQDVNFEYPTRWNGSACLALRYRFDQW